MMIPVAIGLIISQLYLQHHDWRQAARRMVGGIVSMVPKGLVLLTSIAFAIGVIRLGRRQCLVQELPAIEGLARVDTVCLDKTGSLTEGGMRITDLILLDGSDQPNPPEIWPPTPTPTPAAGNRRSVPGSHDIPPGTTATTRHAAVLLRPLVQRSSGPRPDGEHGT
jgi:cation-transporting ATPase E